MAAAAANMAIVVKPTMIRESCELGLVSHKFLVGGSNKDSNEEKWCEHAVDCSRVE